MNIKGLTWWTTRPDGHGPYYVAVDWAGSPAIKSFLTEEWNKADAAGKQLITDLNAKNQMGISEFGGGEENQTAKEEVKVDLEKIKNKKGQIGESSIEGCDAGDELKSKELTTLGKGIFAKAGMYRLPQSQ